MPKRKRALIVRARRRALNSQRIPESLFDRMSDEVLEDDGLVKQVVKVSLTSPIHYRTMFCF